MQMKDRRIGLSIASLLFASALFPQRVVSLAPAVTEIVFALGKGDQLVGVSKFCDFPDQAKKIAKVGGFLDVNLEALLALSPDIVIAYPEHLERLEPLRSRTSLLLVRHRSLSDLFDSILAIGRSLRADEEAHALAAEMKSRLAAIAAANKNQEKTRVLIIAGRNADELRNMLVVGRHDFLNELVEIAGGVNAYQGEVSYPNISLETVLFLDPDVILEISSFYEGIDDERILNLWRPFTMLRAVRNQRIMIIKQSFWLRPGSRVALIAAELADIFASAKAGGKMPQRIAP
jgi:iron complex transport system substrate-binding protein